MRAVIHKLEGELRMGTNEAAARPRLNHGVFWATGGIIGAFGILMVLFPEASGRWLASAGTFTSATFGWFYMLVMVISLGAVLWLGCSRFGRIRLGRDDEQPQFSYLVWVSMLFSAGIGVSLMYFGAYEPVDHFLSPPSGAGGTPEAAREAMVLSFVSWGIHGWALYALVGCALGYFCYRKGMPLALSSALHPIFGDRVHGALGSMLNGFGILVTLIAVVSNIGTGSLTVEAGLSYLRGTGNNQAELITLAVIMMALVTVVIVLGVERGMSRVFSLGVGLLGALMIFVLVTGPTQLLLNGLVQGVGDYLSQFVRKSFDVYLYEKGATEWLGNWTVFYWAWWITWAPFVGMFVARVSRGRQIREVVFGVLLVPLGFTLAWLAIVGNTAIDLVLNHGQAALGKIIEAEPSLSLYKTLEYLPFSPYIAAVAVLVALVLFMGPMGSGLLMISNLSCKGGVIGNDAPIWLRVFWAAVTTVVGVGLLLAGSFNAMMIAVLICGLPFAVVLLLYIVSLRKALVADLAGQEPPR